MSLAAEPNAPGASSGHRRCTLGSALAGSPVLQTTLTSPIQNPRFFTVIAICPVKIKICVGFVSVGSGLVGSVNAAIKLRETAFVVALCYLRLHDLVIPHIFIVFFTDNGADS